MTFYTRRRRKYKIKNNKTFVNGKKGGADREGIVDLAVNEIKDKTSSLFNITKDAVIDAMGLEKKMTEEEKRAEAEAKAVANNEPSMMSEIGSAVNNTSTSAINNVNEVLASPIVSNSVQESAKETAEITGQLAEKFNEAMDDPEVKKEVEGAIKNASELSDVIIDASEEPIKKATKVAVEAGSDALSVAGTGLAKTILDVAGSVPVVGAVVDGLRAINDISTVGSGVVQASSKVINATSDALIEGIDNVKKGMKELEEKKKMAEQITKRTTNSINQFENPLQTQIPQSQSQSAGSNYRMKTKTRKRLFKNKNKSKRVRFAI
jgi:hypothetical protein